MAKAWHDVMEMCRKVFTSKMNSNLDEQHDFPILRVFRRTFAELQAIRRFDWSWGLQHSGPKPGSFGATVCGARMFRFWFVCWRGGGMFLFGLVWALWAFGISLFYCFPLWINYSNAFETNKCAVGLIIDVPYRNLLVWPPIMAVRCQPRSAWGHAGWDHFVICCPLFSAFCSKMHV